MTRIVLTFLFIGVFIHLSAQNPYPKVFENTHLTALKKKVSKGEISKIQEAGLKDLAIGLLDNSYSAKERFREYESYLHPQILAERLKTSPYSQYENPTGIYFEKGAVAQIWVNNLKGKEISLRVTNWDDAHSAQKDYPLKEGYNEFTIENKGNSYIHYYVDNPSDSDPKVGIHILSGQVNGIFDIATHNNQDWKNILESSYGPIIDIVGRQVHLAYPVQALKENAPQQGVELIQLYDSIIGIQHQIMGLTLRVEFQKTECLAE